MQGEAVLGDEDALEVGLTLAALWRARWAAALALRDRHRARRRPRRRGRLHRHVPLGSVRRVPATRHPDRGSPHRTVRAPRRARVARYAAREPVHRVRVAPEPAPAPAHADGRRRGHVPRVARRHGRRHRDADGDRRPARPRPLRVGVHRYLLAEIATIPLWGRFADMYGRKKIFLAGMVIFMVGSVLCGASGSMLQLILFRGIAGCRRRVRAARRADDRGRPLHDQGTSEDLGGVLGGVRVRVDRRSAGRRLPHRTPVVALGVLREPAHRHVHDRDGRVRDDRTARSTGTSTASTGWA